MWIWICGPYATGGADRERRAANLRVLNEAALAVFRMGHIPVIGANMALPIIATAGADDASHEIRLPLSCEHRVEKWTRFSIPNDALSYCDSIGSDPMLERSSSAAMFACGSKERPRDRTSRSPGSRRPIVPFIARSPIFHGRKTGWPCPRIE